MSKVWGLLGLSLAAASLASVIAAVPVRAEQAVPPAVDDLPDPPELVSRNGVLEATLTAAPSPLALGFWNFTSNVYNGLYVAPTLRVRPGDELRLTLLDRTGPADVQIGQAQQTNLHFHGLDTKPRVPGDDVFVRVGPGRGFRYTIDLPKDHPEGLNWYHPHVHGLIGGQILSGMAGMLVVDGYIERHYPELAGLRRRVMVLKGAYPPGWNPEAPPFRTVNGLLDPPIKARPGEYQVWEVGNLNADSYVDLALDGHELWTIERDGNVQLRPFRQTSLLLTPGARATVVVRAGAPGSYALRSRAVDTGPGGDPNPEAVIGTLVVGGAPVEHAAIDARLKRPAAHPETISPRPDLVRALAITGRRTIELDESADGTEFSINGRAYDENRTDVTVHVGDVEEWTIRNPTAERHVFHIHQTEFLVETVDGVRPAFQGLVDTADVPYAQNGKPGEVKLLIPFTNPRIAGTFVFHCHLAEHEDGGMMANIRVLPRRTLAADAWDGLRRLAGLEPTEGAGAGPDDLAGAICRSPAAATE